QLRGKSPMELPALQFLALILPDLYKLRQADSVLDEAITVTELVISRIPEDAPDHESYQRRLAVLQQLRHPPTSEPDAAMRPGPEEQDPVQRILRKINRANETGDLDHLRDALATLREVTGMEAAERGDHFLAEPLAALLITWVGRTRDLAALEEALSLLRHITASRPTEDSLFLLGQALCMRADSIADPEAVEEGVTVLRRAA